MADATDVKLDETKAEAAAEKAYAAAAEQVEAVEVKPAPAAAKPAVAEKAAAKPVTAEKAPAKKAPTKKAPAKKAVAPKAAAKVAPKAAKAGKPAAKKLTPKKAAAPKAAPRKSAKATTPFAQFKDMIMAKTTTEDFTAKMKDAVAEMQERAKAAYEKSSEVASEYGEFTKGNVEALVEAGKVLVAGVQDMGKDYVAEAKTALETVTADVKELAAAKTPADFFKLQGEIMRRNFDNAMAFGSKNSEALVKLANDSFAPISSRVSLAIEKVKKAA